MIIWSGWGVLVVVILVVVGGGVAGLVGAAGTLLGPAMQSHIAGVGIGLGGLAAAAVNWWTGRRLNGGTGRVLLDPATGQQVVLRRTHSLFFIPMQWWSVPIAVMAAFLLLAGLFGSGPSAAPSSPAASRPL